MILVVQIVCVNLVQSVGVPPHQSALVKVVVGTGKEYVLVEPVRRLAEEERPAVSLANTLVEDGEAYQFVRVHTQT